MSPIAGPSQYRTVIGVWTKKTNTNHLATDAVDVEAHLETPPTNFSLPMRPPMCYPTCHESQATPDALDQFFASGDLDARRSSRDTISGPPPYSPGECAYTMTDRQPDAFFDKEQPTLARMLFMYGFLFFPFWLAGAYILCSPLLPTPDWEAGKTEMERTLLLQLLRKIELKWARRCLLAIFGLFVVVFLLVLFIKYGVLRAL